VRTLSNLARFALDRQAIKSAVRLQLLGPPQAWRDEQPLAFKTRKTRALLAYLAAERGLHPRDQLAALLWPDRGEAEARNSLRSALVYLRQALGDADAALAVTRETVGLSLSPSCILDIQVLAQAQRLARRPEVVPGLQAALERAVAAYGGRSWRA
jgi:DNA-binding SARP family transcriptional activator